MKKLTPQIVDTQQELKAMQSYILQTWDGNPEFLNNLVAQSFHDGLEQSKNSIGTSVQDKILETTQTWIEERRNTFSEEDKFFQNHDQICSIPSRFLIGLMQYERIQHKDFSFEKETNKKLNEFFKLNPKEKIQPKGFEEAIKSGKDAYDLFASFSLKSDNLFKGHDSTSAVVGGFHQRANLANTFYDVTSQNQKVHNVLYQAAFSHGMIIASHNNAVSVLKTFKELKKTYTNKNFPGITYIGDLTKISNNPLFNVLMIEKYQTEKPYSNQEQLNAFLESEKDRVFKYGMASFNFIDNKGDGHVGFLFQKVYNIEHFEKQIKEKIDVFFNQNHDLPFSKQMFVSSFKIKEFSRLAFNTLKTNMKAINEDKLQEGESYPFLEYNFPSKEEIAADNSKKLRESLTNKMKSGKADLNEDSAQNNSESLEEKYLLNVKKVLSAQNQNKHKKT